MIMIFQAKNPTLRAYGRLPSVERLVTEFDMVAKVEGEDLEAAFEATQAHEGQDFRSTAVGDILVRENSDGTYGHYEVAGVGFNDLGTGA